MDLSPVEAWLVSREARGLEADALLAGLGERLRAAGIPVERVRAALRTMHPEVVIVTYEWAPGFARARVEDRTAGPRLTEEFARSPVMDIVADPTRPVRVDLDQRPFPYGICAELAEVGMRDYLVMELPQLASTIVSYASSVRLADDAVAALFRLRLPLSLRLELEAARHATRSLLRAYLGPNAAARVLEGAFHRGDGEAIRAVIWMSDLRGFTTLSDRRPLDEVIDTLDRSFERIADPIALRGGEVLKLIGDAVLAVFPLGRDPEGACRGALAAAREALAGLADLSEALRADGRPPLSAGIALHVGDVLYGNVGARDRLDFTVIGPAVNEVSRVEGLCKELGRPLLLTDDFARALGDPDRLEPLGEHPLRGVSRWIPLFAPR